MLLLVCKWITLILCFVCFSSVPGPPSLWVHQDSESSAVVRWLPPELLASGLELLGYRLQFGRKDVPPLATLEFAPYEREFSVSSMHRGATYIFKISAKSRSGFGEEAKQELSLDEEAPHGYPHIRDASNITCCSVHFSWLPPVLAERNGAITEYTLAYQEAGTTSMPLELRLPATEHSYTLNSLKPDSLYDVKIRAHTSVGPGPYSPTIQYRTMALTTGSACFSIPLSPEKKKNRQHHNPRTENPSTYTVIRLN